MGCVYLITSPSGKQYVGQTVRTFEERWQGHINEAFSRAKNFIFHRAIRKYGPDAFTHVILHNGIEDKSLLNQLEIEEIARRNTMSPNGYNMTIGGESGPTRGSLAYAKLVAAIRTDEHRKKKSLISKEMWMDPGSVFNSEAYAEKRSEWMKNAHANSSNTESWYLSIKRAHADPEVKKKLSNSVREARAKPGVKERSSRVMRESKLARVEAVMCDGALFACMKDAESHFRLGGGTALYRCKSTRHRWSGWFKFPKHNDPECDAVEECWAFLEFSRANPHHPNVPGWARQDADPELVALDLEVKEMLAERRRLWQAQQRVADRR